MRVDRERQELPVDDDLVDAVTIEVHRASRPRGAAVLLTHGAGKDLDAPHLVGLADAIAGTGRLVVRANQPWKQAGRAAPPRADRAVPGYAAVVEAVRAAHGPRRDWVVGGQSNGARIATHVAAERAADVAGLLLVSYPLHPPGKPDALRTDHWPRIRVPVLVLQGTNDAFGGADEVADHLRLLPAGARVHPVAGADHGFAVPRTRSPDGRRHEPHEVGASLGEVVGAWLDEVT